MIITTDGYKDCYQVSNLGRFKSLDRKIRYSNGIMVKPNSLLAYMSGKRYPHLGLEKISSLGKLSKEQVIDIFLSKVDNKTLGIKYSVGTQHISKINDGSKWSSITINVSRGISN